MQLPSISIGIIVEVVVALGGLASFLAGVKYLGRWIKERDEDFKALEAQVTAHHTNTQIHTDPVRDERRWQELISNVSRLSDSMSKLSESFIAHRAAFEAFLITRNSSSPAPVIIDRKEHQ